MEITRSTLVWALRMRKKNKRAIDDEEPGVLPPTLNDQRNKHDMDVKHPFYEHDCERNVNDRRASSCASWLCSRQVTVRSWRANASFLEKPFPQTEHLNGFIDS